MQTHLDKSRDYGVVRGHREARYEQDGELFGANGVNLKTPGENAKKEEVVKKQVEEMQREAAAKGLMELPEHLSKEEQAYRENLQAEAVEEFAD